MPTLKIDSPGSLFPALEKRDLAAAGAQDAHNLHAGSPKFRPLGGPTTVVAASGVTNPKTIYRLARTSAGAFNDNPSTGWIVRSQDINFVKGQLNDDTTERTYYAFNDGSAPPRVLNASGADRQLGVPTPATAPTVTLQAVSEFLPEDRDSAIEAAQDKIATLIRANLTTAWLGAPEPGTGTQGYVNLQDNPTAATTQQQMARVFRLTSRQGAFNGRIENTYATAGPDAFSWVYDLAANPFFATTNASSPTWQSHVNGQSKDHICLAFPAYALTYSLNTSALSSALKALPLPGAQYTSNPSAKLFTADEVDGADGIVTRLNKYASTTQNPEVAKLLSEVRTKFDELKVVLAGGTGGTLSSEVTAFYAKTDVATEISTALNTLARYIEISRFTLRSQALSNEGASGGD